jgi:hypothetical protein
MFKRVNRFIFYYVLISFLISSALLLWNYFDLSPILFGCTYIYGISIVILTTILFLLYLFKAFGKGSTNKRALFNCILLFVGGIIFYFQIRAWNYITNAIVFQIINNTGHEVTDVGLYGCSEDEENKRTLSINESYIIRLPQDGSIRTSCAYIIEYKLNGQIRREVLRREEETKNVYYLGTHHNEFEE